MELIVNEYASPGHGIVHVRSYKNKTGIGGEIGQEFVEIHATGGYVVLTYDQWKTMISLGMSMMMQERNLNSGKTG